MRRVYLAYFRSLSYPMNYALRKQLWFKRSVPHTQDGCVGYYRSALNKSFWMHYFKVLKKFTFLFWYILVFQCPMFDFYYYDMFSSNNHHHTHFTRTTPSLQPFNIITIKQPSLKSKAIPQLHYNSQTITRYRKNNPLKRAFKYDCFST